MREAGARERFRPPDVTDLVGDGDVGQREVVALEQRRRSGGARASA
jgi:hypothetical protein